jgi:hypothetical protein
MKEKNETPQKTQTEVWVLNRASYTLEIGLSNDWN